MNGGSPRCGACQRLAGGAVGDVGCDDREDKPGGQEPPPVKFGSKVERNYPHLEQSHQLQDNREQDLGDACAPGGKLLPSSDISRHSILGECEKTKTSDVSLFNETSVRNVK